MVGFVRCNSWDSPPLCSFTLVNGVCEGLDCGRPDSNGLYSMVGSVYGAFDGRGVFLGRNEHGSLFASSAFYQGYWNCHKEDFLCAVWCRAGDGGLVCQLAVCVACYGSHVALYEIGAFREMTQVEMV